MEVHCVSFIPLVICALDNVLQVMWPGSSFEMDGDLGCCRVRVQAVNGVGVGGWSNPCRVTTSPLPPLPPRLECTTAGHNSLRLRWVHPSLSTSSSSPSSPMLYTLEMENPRKGGWQVMYTGSSHSHKVGRLSETTIHRFRISASNESGQGPYSPVAAFTTLKAPPATLKCKLLYYLLIHL